MPTISLTPLKINFLTNFQEEPIAFTKNIFHTEDKDASSAIGLPITNNYPYICTNIKYKNNLFYGKDLSQIINIIFNEDKFISYISNKYGSIDKAEGLFVNSSLRNCKCSFCKNEIIRNNVLFTLSLLFPISFPTNNHIIDSLSTITSNTAEHFFSRDTMNSLYYKDYSYIKHNNNIYTFSKIIWLNDLLNHPLYIKYIKRYHKYHSYMFEGKENSIINDFKNIYYKLDEDIDKLLLDIKDNLIIPVLNNINNIEVFTNRQMLDDTTLNNAGIIEKAGIIDKNGDIDKYFTYDFKNDIYKLITLKNIIKEAYQSDSFDIDSVMKFITPDKLLNNEFNSIKDIHNAFLYDNIFYYEANNNFDDFIDDDMSFDDYINKLTMFSKSMDFGINKDSTNIVTKQESIYDSYFNKDNFRNIKLLFIHLSSLNKGNNFTDVFTTFTSKEIEIFNKAPQFKNSLNNENINFHGANNKTFMNSYSKKYNNIFSSSIDSIKKLLKSIFSLNEKNKSVSTIVSSNNDLRNVPEVLSFKDIDYKFNPGDNKEPEYGNSTNDLLNDIIKNLKINRKSDIYSPHKTISNVDINDHEDEDDVRCLTRHKIIESIYKKFIEGNGSIDSNCLNLILDTILDSGISIVSTNDGKKYAEIFVLADFINGQINDENIGDIKCKYYNEKLGLLIDDMLIGDDPNNWNATTGRMYITEPPPKEEGSISQQGMVPSGPIPNSGMMPQRNNLIAPNNAQSQNNEFVERTFRDFILSNNNITNQIDQYNKYTSTRISENDFFPFIREKYPYLFDLIIAWSNIESNINNPPYKQQILSKLIKTKSDINQQLEVLEVQNKATNITPDEKYKIEAYKRRYNLFKIATDELSKDIEEFYASKSKGGKIKKSRKKRKYNKKTRKYKS
jgi:hypothetical protein